MKKVLLSLLTLLLLLPGAAMARPGSLDPSFGRSGKVLKSVPGAFREAAPSETAIAKLDAGRTVVLVGGTLLGLEADGSPLRRFGGGRVTVEAPPGGLLELVDVAADEQGRVLVAGTVTTDPAGPAPLDYDLFLARYNRDGRPDPGFGEGGVLRGDFGAAPPEVFGAPPVPAGPPPPPPPLTRAGGIAVGDDGRVVASGVRVAQIGPCRSHTQWQFGDAFAVRLSSNGELDPSFGAGGIASIPNAQRVNPPLMTSTGSVYLWTLPDNGCFSASRQLTRLFSAGAPDPSFGAGGQVTIPSEIAVAPGGIALDRAGRIVLLTEGYVPPSAKAAPYGVALLRRLLPSGQPDRSFGGKGTVTVGIGQGGFSPSALAIERSGAVLVAGTADATSRRDGSPQTFQVSRVSSSGERDRSFGHRGWAWAGAGRLAKVGAPTLAVVPGRRVLVAAAFSRPAREGVAVFGFRSR